MASYIPDVKDGQKVTVKNSTEIDFNVFSGYLLLKSLKNSITKVYQFEKGTYINDKILSSNKKTTSDDSNCRTFYNCTWERSCYSDYGLEREVVVTITENSCGRPNAGQCPNVYEDWHTTSEDVFQHCGPGDPNPYNPGLAVTPLRKYFNANSQIYGFPTGYGSDYAYYVLLSGWTEQPNLGYFYDSGLGSNAQLLYKYEIYDYVHSLRRFYYSLSYNPGSPEYKGYIGSVPNSTEPNIHPVYVYLVDGYNYYTTNFSEYGYGTSTVTFLGVPFYMFD